MHLIFVVDVVAKLVHMHPSPWLLVSQVLPRLLPSVKLLLTDVHASRVLLAEELLCAEAVLNHAIRVVACHAVDVAHVNRVQFVFIFPISRFLSIHCERVDPWLLVMIAISFCDFLEICLRHLL